MSDQTDLIDFVAELVSSGADTKDHLYDILRVHPSAEQEIIESAYRRLLRLYHPDVNKHPMASEITKVLISAYEVLGDGDKRTEYNAYLSSKENDLDERVNSHIDSREAYDGIEAYCLKCRDWHEVRDPEEVTLRNGRSAIRGRCTACSSIVFRISGQATSSSHQTKQIDFYLERGEAYSDEGEIHRAIEDFTRVIELDPSNETAYQWRGCLYGQINRTLAIQDFTKATELDPSNWVAYRSRSSAYYYKGDPNLAVQDYAKAEVLFTKHPSGSKHDPDSVQGLLRHFTFGILIGDTCKIRSNTSREEFLNLVNFYTRFQESAGRERAFIYGQIGQDYLDHGEFILAIQSYTKAIELDPDSVYAFLGRSFAYMRKGEYDLVIQDLTRVIEIEPNDAFAYQARAQAYSERGESNLAARDYAKATAIEKLQDAPPDVMDSNVQKYTEAISRYPHRSSNYKFRGNAYLKIGHIELAIEDFNRAIELNPNSASNYEHRAKGYAEIGENQLAAADKNTARRLRSGHHRTSSAKTRTTSATGASPRTAENERSRTQQGSNYSAYSTQTSQPQYQTSSRPSGEEVSKSQENSVVGQAVFLGIVFAIIAGAIEALIVIFWNDTAASIVGALFLILVAWCIWGNGKLSYGLKGLLTLCGIGSIMGFAFIMWVIGIDSDKVGSVGFAAIMGGVFAVTLAITPDE